jgi:Mn-dependent DtxR family transcriptional regulator
MAEDTAPLNRTTEDYLKTIYIMQGNERGVRNIDLAERLGVSRPTVSVVLKRLLTDGYITMNRRREYFLTDEGTQIAEAMLERHETFRQLLETLGIDQETAAEDACRMEHAVSQKSFEALREMANRI